MSRAVSAIDNRPLDEPLDDDYDLQPVDSVSWAGMNVDGHTHIEPARQVPLGGMGDKSAAQTLMDRSDAAVAVSMADQLNRQYRISPAIRPAELLALRARGHSVRETTGNMQETMIEHILADRVIRRDNGEQIEQSATDEKRYPYTIEQVCQMLDAGGVSISKRGLERAISAGVIPGFPNFRQRARGGKPQRFAGREYVRTIKAILLARRS